MPIYEYRCENGHTFEVLQSMSDAPVAACEQCAAAVERVFHPVAVHFKGSGFYTTDYKKKAAAAKAGGDGGEAKGESGDDSGGGDSGAGDSGSDSKSSTESKPSSSDKAAKGSGSGE